MKLAKTRENQWIRSAVNPSEDTHSASTSVLRVYSRRKDKKDNKREDGKEKRREKRREEERKGDWPRGVSFAPFRNAAVSAGIVF